MYVQETTIVHAYLFSPPISLHVPLHINSYRSHVGCKITGGYNIEYVKIVLTVVFSLRSRLCGQLAVWTL